LSFLLDSDICSAYLKNNPRVGNRVLQYGGRLCVSVITTGELYTWALRAKASPKRMTKVIDFIGLVTILQVDHAVAHRFGLIHAAMLDASLRRPAKEPMNAATALVHGLTMVTHNTRDYADVPALSLADWLGP
jgi:tRNA(fMet)-specific endonuclease VapC